MNIPCKPPPCPPDPWPGIDKAWQEMQQFREMLWQVLLDMSMTDPRFAALLQNFIINALVSDPRIYKILKDLITNVLASDPSISAGPPGPAGPQGAPGPAGINISYVGATAPPNPQNGEMWLDTTDNSLHIYEDGTGWVDISGGGIPVPGPAGPAGPAGPPGTANTTIFATGTYTMVTSASLNVWLGGTGVDIGVTVDLTNVSTGISGLTGTWQAVGLGGTDVLIQRIS